MKTRDYLWSFAKAGKKYALPVLSFPAVQKMGITVRELVENAQYQAEAMAVVAREVPSIAAVSLMDLSVEAQAFHAQVVFHDMEVPTITGKVVCSQADAEALRTPTVGDGRTGLCVEAIKRAKAMIQDRPVLAGVIGPYSLAGRLCGVTDIMYLCFDEPETVHTVLKKATDFLIRYCLAFRNAGADGVVMAEPLAGLLSPDMSKEFSCDYTKQIIDAVQTEDFAVIYHNCGNAVDKMLPEIFSVGAAAYHFGNAVDMAAILNQAPEDKLCMGNIDPAGQFACGTPAGMKEAVRKLLTQCAGKRNFILSSGCDIPPHAKWENIHAFFEAIDEINREE